MCRALPEVTVEEQQRITFPSEPKRFFIPAYLGSRGWVGLNLDVPEVDWEEVSELVRDSYLLIAPKRLGRIVN